MTITVNDESFNLSEQYAEYLSLLRAQAEKAGGPKLSDAQAISRILAENYFIATQKNPALRPASVAEKLKAIEQAAASVLRDSVGLEV